MKKVTNQNNYIEDYTKSISEIIHIIEKEEKENIRKASEVIYQALKKDLILHVFATGHSHMMAEEMFYRAGGLVPIDPILEPFLMQHEGAVRSTKFERLTGVSEIIFNSLNLKNEEPFMIVSNSGINAVVVEMAKIAHQNGHPVIGVTSREASKNSKPRTITNEHLYEVCDIVIDNHVPKGDCLIESKNGFAGASSSIMCSYIAQSLVLAIISLYEEDGLVPPIYQSANTFGGDEHNKVLYEKFAHRIKSLY